MITALIPARSGSKRIPNKNITLLGGHPLLTWSIAVAKMCPKIDETWVSTDDLTYADIAEKYGAKIIMRPPEICGDGADDDTYIRHFLTKVKTDFIVLLRPTTPLRYPILLNRLIMDSIPGVLFTGARSVESMSESSYKTYEIDNQTLIGLIDPCRWGHERFTVDDANVPNDRLPKTYRANGYADIIRTDNLEIGTVFGLEVKALYTPRSIEIDCPEDLEYAEWYLSKHGSVLLEYLNQITKV